VRFADVDDEGVKLVVVAGEVFGFFGGLFRGKGLFGESLYFGILRMTRNQGVTDGDAAQVFIDHHGRDIEGVEENRIRRFGTDAGKSKELLADCGSVGERGLTDGFQLAIVVRVEL
jgi:hypothetical protein